jgi:hypothetical protein
VSSVEMTPTSGRVVGARLEVEPVEDVLVVESR